MSSLIFRTKRLHKIIGPRKPYQQKQGSMLAYSEHVLSYFAFYLSHNIFKENCVESARTVTSHKNYLKKVGVMKHFVTLKKYRKLVRHDF